MTFRDSISTAIDRNKDLCVVLSSFIFGIVLWGFGYTFSILFVYIQEEFNSSTTATDLIKMHYANSPKITRVSCFATLGVTIGFFIQSPLVGKLLIAIGWRSVLRIYSGLTLIVGLTCSMFMQTPDTRHENKVKSGRDVDETTTKPEQEEEHNLWNVLTYLYGVVYKQEEEHNLWNVLTCLEWWFFLIGMVLTTTATLFSYVNIVDFMKSAGISPYVSSWILTGSAVAEACGKTFLAVFGDRMTFPKLYILPPNNILLAAIMIVLIYARTSLHMIILVICMGFLRSIFHSIPYLATIELLGSRRNTESTVLTCLGYGIGSFCGTLVGGLSVDFTGSYDVGLLISCGMLIVGAIFLQAAPLYQKVFASERYLVDNKMASDKIEISYEYIIDSYITTV
ncbi:uncharacterized protein [Antedon mediterranea]|uniref:uncharacterized protein n=1 Tax=Antedon mediterranea TaxID=105859 RepID=UPI003AF6F3CF